MKYLTILLCLFTLSAQGAITISGVVTDGNGNPVSKCDVFFNSQAWIADDSIHVKCDEKGNYSTQIEPGLYNSVYICDEEEYGKTKLEFWGWNLQLEQSQTLNAQFDAMEVYSLSAWASNGGSNSIFASFRPMSLSAAKAPTYRKIQHNGKQITLFDIAPTLTADHIKGFVDDKALELIDYSWTYEKVASCSTKGEKGCYMPMIIAQFKKPKLQPGRHVLKIDIRDAKSHEFGQGITHFVSNEKSLGF